MLKNIFNKNKIRKEQTIHEMDGIQIPIIIYYEKRRNVRASIGKKAVNFRLPYNSTLGEKRGYFEWLEKFLSKQKDLLEERFKVKIYQSGNTLVVGDRSYELSIESSDNKSHSGRLKNGTIFLKINHSQSNSHKAVKALLSRVVGADFLPEITRRVHELNRLYFQVPIGKVKLKYTTSRWGSCSSNGNINFSTKLLFAPDDVIDYLIIHELAHRIEMNHSAKFWKLVSDAMPDYKQKEKWLKEYGKTCDF